MYSASVFVWFCVVSQQDNKWLPQELVRKQIFVYSTFLLKSSADIFHSSVVEHSLFLGCWAVVSQHRYYKMTQWPLVEGEVTEGHFSGGERNGVIPEYSGFSSDFSSCIQHFWTVLIQVQWHFRILEIQLKRCTKTIS